MATSEHWLIGITTPRSRLPLLSGSAPALPQGPYLHRLNGYCRSNSLEGGIDEVTVKALLGDLVRTVPAAASS